MAINRDPLGPIHPGEILREEFLVPMDLTPYALAKALNVPRTRIERLVREEVDLSVDTALRLARYFGMTPQFWLGAQAQYALESADKAAIEAIVPRGNPAPRPPRGRRDRAA